MANKKYQFDDIRDIPVHLASESLWRRRGIKPVNKNDYQGEVNWWNGMNYQNFKLYHINNCKPINGKKAMARRREFFNFLLKYTCYPLYKYINPEIRKLLKE